MADPETIGTLVAWALGLGADALRRVVGEAAKDAYNALKAKLSPWAAQDVTALEQTPSSKPRRAVIAETIDSLPLNDQETLRGLAQVLIGKLREEAPLIGLDIGRLEALEVHLGDINAAQGVGARIQEASVSGIFRAGDISVGLPPGKR